MKGNNEGAENAQHPFMSFLFVCFLLSTEFTFNDSTIDQGNISYINSHSTALIWGCGFSM